MRELIEVRYNQNIFYMTPLQIEAAYRYQQKQYRLQDCRNHLEELAFGGPAEYIEECQENELRRTFFERYGVEYTDALNLLDEMLQRFEKRENCNIDENMIWETAITEVLLEHRNHTRQ